MRTVFFINALNPVEYVLGYGIPARNVPSEVLQDQFQRISPAKAHVLRPR
jgi:hypothetical protein